MSQRHPTAALREVSLPHAYSNLVQEWRALTGQIVWPQSGHCCLTVTDGLPECAHSIINGNLYTGGHLMTFTGDEILALIELNPGLRKEHWRGTVDSRIAVFSGGMDETELHAALSPAGWMANTIERASHPLRPIIGPAGIPIGTVAVPGCNTSLAYGYYRSVREEILTLWKDTVEIFGTKPYYVETHIKPEWTVL